VHYNPYGGSAARIAAGLVNLGAAPGDRLMEFMRDEGMSLTRLSAAEAAGVAAWASTSRNTGVGGTCDSAQGRSE
jgi:hypothetical protein